MGCMADPDYEDDKMESDKEIIERRKQKIKTFLLNNLLFVLMLVVIIGIRIFYFLTVKNNLWWDEADYMNIVNLWNGQNPYWTFNVIRPVLLPLIGFCLSFFGNTELLMRVFILATSIGAVIFLYALGSLMFNKTTGLIASFMLATFWSFSFYSFRVLTDVPLVFLWLGSIYFFFKGLKDNKYKWYVLSGVFLGFSALMKFSSIILIVVFGLYLLITERHKMFFNIKNYVFALSAFIVFLPYLIWQKLKFGSAVAFYTSATATAKQHTFMQSLINQTVFSVKILDLVIIVSLIIGVLFILLKLYLNRESIFKKGTETNCYAFLLIWISVGLLFFGWLNYGSYMDERYYFVFYVAFFLISAVLFEWLIYFFEGKTKVLMVIIICGLLLFSAFTNFKQADNTIKVKKDSFMQLKSAGLFINQNSNTDEAYLIIEEAAEVNYYAQRKYNLDGTLTGTEDLLKKIEEYNPKFIVISFYYTQSSEDKLKVVDYIFKHPDNFVPVAGFEPFIIPDQKVPLVIVFQVKSKEGLA